MKHAKNIAALTFWMGWNIASNCGNISKIWPYCQNCFNTLNL
jgi:hypothetical protein